MRVAIGANGVTIGNLSCPNLKLQGSPAGTGSGPNPAAQALVQQCVTQLGLKETLTYQPAGRYWAFQGYETGLFLALSLILSGSCFWLIRRRLA
jgi:hypothetical protein